MVRNWGQETERCLSVEEALAVAEESFDPTSFDSLVEHAWVLNALSNDRTFLPRRVCEDLKKAVDGRATQTYSSQSMLLGQGEKCAFRANFWFPSPPEAERSRLEKKLYSYELPHDHNFHFATVGYSGPGYRTDIYRYEREAVRGLVDEEVELQFCETLQLSPGTLLLFESGRDVHTQYAPEALSISLNLLSRDPLEAAQPQYLFDRSATRIASLAEHKLTRSISLIRFAKFVGNEETIELIDAVVTDAPEPILRAAGLDALLHLYPEADRTKLEQRIADDPDTLMSRRIAQIGGFRL